MVVSLMASCGNDYEVDEYFDLEELPGYVAFDADGNSITLEDFSTSEVGDPINLTIECPTGTLSDITVNYSVSGDAVLGVDYMIDGLSGTSGSIVLVTDPSDNQDNDRVDLVITPLDDGVVDGDKSLTITLTSASNAEGDVAVGRGGTDYLKTANITLIDIGCSKALAGTYDAVTNGEVGDGAGGQNGAYDEVVGAATFTELGPGEFSIDDITAGMYAAVYQLSPVEVTIQQGCDGINITAGMDEYDDPFTGTGTIDDDGIITISWGNTWGDTGTTVFTPQ